jgi:hypothetical protein
MRWGTLPTKIQRELFEYAISLTELIDPQQTAHQKGQIARLLHDRKDDSLRRDAEAAVECLAWGNNISPERKSHGYERAYSGYGGLLLRRVFRGDGSPACVAGPTRIIREKTARVKALRQHIVGGDLREDRHAREMMPGSPTVR